VCPSNRTGISTKGYLLQDKIKKMAPFVSYMEGHLWMQKVIEAWEVNCENERELGN